MINHFKNLDFATDFNIDLDALEDKYLAFQKQFHPDNASSADVEKSISINASYTILQNPIARASHILQLNDIDLENDEKAPKPDMETLEEIFELQEKVSDVDVNETSELKKYLKSEIKSLLNEVAAEIDNKDFSKAAQILIRVKYFNKTLENLKTK